MQMFLEPTNPKQWNLFDKVDSIGHIETFRATSDMRVGDFVLISVGTQDKNIQSGVYAIGVILSKPYILRDSPEDYCNNKLTVNVVITRFYKDTPIINKDSMMKFSGNYRRANKISENHYDRLLKIINQ